MNPEGAGAVGIRSPPPAPVSHAAALGANSIRWLWPMAEMGGILPSARSHCLRHLRPIAIALKVPFRSTTKAPLVSGNTVILYLLATARLNFGSSVKM